MRKKFVLTPLIVPCLIPVAAVATNLETLKAPGLAIAWQSALQNPPPVPASAPGKLLPLEGSPSKQILTYERGGYPFDWNAKNASAEATNNMRQAGIAALGSMIIRDPQTGDYAFRIEYLDDPGGGWPPRTIEAFTSGTFNTHGEAQNARNLATANLRAIGFPVILARVLTQKDWPWGSYYQIDYVRGKPNQGGPLYTYTSSYFFSKTDAERNRDAMVLNLQAQGYIIESALIYEDARTRYYYFQILYKGRWLR
jgi:hypothetical protein